MPDEAKKLKDESQIQEDSWKLLAHISSAVSKSLNIEDVLHLIIEETKNLIAVDRASIILIDKYNKTFEGSNVPVSTSPNSLGIQKDKPYQIWDSDKSSEIVVPLKIGEDVIGALNLESSTPHTLTSEDAILLELFASQAAIAIENARLFKEAQIRKNSLQEMLESQTAVGINATNRDTNILHKERDFGISRNLNNIEFDSDESAFSIHMTPDALTNTIIPYIRAIYQLQEIIDEINGQESNEIHIKSITQNSPISVSLDGASDAIQLIRDIVTPWRNKHIKELASLLEREKLLEIENKKAEVLERRALAEKSRNEAKKISVEMEIQREDVKRMKLENEKLRIEVHREKIKLALEVLKYISPGLSETEKIAYVVKILQPLDILVMSDINFSLTDKK